MNDAHPLHPSLAGEKLLDVLRLIRSENVGAVTFFKLVEKYGSAKAALDMIGELSIKGGRSKPIRAFSKELGEMEVEQVHKFGAKFLMYGQTEYPELLHHIPDPPPVLTLKGHSSVWQKKTCLAIVGSRNASANGCQWARKLAEDVGKRNITTVSGLARGIDTFAHKGSLESGTVAVIAGGITNIYPPENKDLFDQITELGAVISEQLWNMPPHAKSFPSRNRIIAGMSHGTVVVEANFQSGSLITARCALEYNRDIFAVPGSPLDARCRGTNDLIRHGAVLTESAEDIMPILAAQRQLPLREMVKKDLLPRPEIPSERELAEARAAFRAKLGASPVQVEEVQAQTQLSPSLLSHVLLEMELAGSLKRYPGNRICLSYEALEEAKEKEPELFE